MNKRRREQIKKIVEACGWGYACNAKGDVFLLLNGRPEGPPFNPFGYDSDLDVVLGRLSVTVVHHRRIRDHGFDYAEIHRDGDRQTHCATGEGFNEAVCKAILKMLRAKAEMRKARADRRRVEA